MSGIIERSFGINIKIMSVLGFYSCQNSKTQKMKVYLMFVILAVTPPILAFLYFLYGEELDALQFNYNGAFTAEFSGFSIKLFPVIWRSERIRKCIHYFDEPFFKTKTRDERRIVEDCMKTCRRNTRYIIGPMLIVGALSWIIRPLFTKGYTLPVDIWLPFNTKKSKITYYIAYAYTSMAIVYGACTIVVDTLIGGLAHHASTQLAVLQYNLQNLSKHIEKDNCEKNVKFRIIYDRIAQCVKHHNKILTFVNEFEECFSFTVLSQFASSAFVVCFGCLQLILVPLSHVNNTIGSMACILLASVQIYFYCYYGTMLFEENNNLTKAIYSSEWYEYDVKSKQALITMLEYSNQPLIVTAGKILDLSLGTFTSIIKRSYSLLAVLKNYQ